MATHVLLDEWNEDSLTHYKSFVFNSIRPRDVSETSSVTQRDVALTSFDGRQKTGAMASVLSLAFPDKCRKKLILLAGAPLPAKDRASRAIRGMGR